MPFSGPAAEGMKKMEALHVGWISDEVAVSIHDHAAHEDDLSDESTK